MSKVPNSELASSAAAIAGVCRSSFHFVSAFPFVCGHLRHWEALWLWSNCAVTGGSARAADDHNGKKSNKCRWFWKAQSSVLQLLCSSGGCSEHSPMALSGLSCSAGAAFAKAKGESEHCTGPALHDLPLLTHRFYLTWDLSDLLFKMLINAVWECMCPRGSWSHTSVLCCSAAEATGVRSTWEVE